MCRNTEKDNPYNVDMDLSDFEWDDECGENCHYVTTLRLWPGRTETLEDGHEYEELEDVYSCGAYDRYLRKVEDI